MNSGERTVALNLELCLGFENAEMNESKDDSGITLEDLVIHLCMHSMHLF